MPSPLDVEIYHCDWTQSNWRASFRRIPAIALLLLVGLFLGKVQIGVLAAAAAYSIGFGATKQIRGSRLLAMLATAATMAFSALVGTTAGNYYPAVLAVTGIWGLVCGYLNVLDEDIGWIAIQGVITLQVAMAFPSWGLEAGGRSALILIGGLIQVLSICIFWHCEGISRFGSESTRCGAPRPVLRPAAEFWKSVRASLVFSSTGFQYAARVAITMMIAVELDHLLKLKNGYWLPMTTIVVLKPDFFRTYTNGVQRVIGTLTGVLAATAIAYALRPENYVLITLIGFFAYFSYVFQKANPVIFSASATSFAVFLIALTGLPEGMVTWHRLLNTALGCAVALTSRFIGLKMLGPLLPHEIARQIFPEPANEKNQ